MQRRIRVLDVVALVEDVQAHGLLRGHVGTVVERLGETGMVEVEFSDDHGRCYALVPLSPAELMVLHHRQVRTM